MTGPRSWVTELLVGSEEPATPEELRAIRGRQIQVAVRIVTIANLANIASTAMTTAFLIPPGPFRNAWGAAALLVIVNSCRMWLPWLLDRQRPASHREQVRLTLDVAVGGVLYGILGAHVVPQLFGAEQAVLVSTIVGLIGAGAIALSTVRSVAFTWLGTIVAGLMIGFIADGTDELPLELAQLTLYATALCAAISYLAWSFAQRCRAEQAAGRSRDVVTLLLDDFEGGARDWLWHTDPRGRLLSPSSRFAECIGLAPADIERRTLFDLVDPEPVGAGDDLQRALAAGIDFRDIVVPVRARGERRWWSLSGAPRADGSWRGVGSDITQAHEHDREMHRLASIDVLTGLANRHQFSIELQTLVSGRVDGEHVQLSIIDLDNFKTVNDTLGHRVGDVLLAEAARRLHDAVGPGATCARLGGDEFAVVSLVQPDDPADAFAQALGAVFDRPYDIDGTRLEVRGSVGQATIPGDTDDADELVMLADLAMYAAKDAGSGQIRRFEPAMRSAAESRARAQRDLRLAIAERSIGLRFQPLVDPSGEVVAFEALARWHHPEHGTISPASFIAVAEDTGLIGPLGDQLLDLALAAATTWPDSVRLAVNVAPAQLLSTGFADRFRCALDRHGVAAQRVDVEVTESTVVDPEAQTAIAELRRCGCGIAVDDFGTGYSSFGALQELPITQLKIDRAFIERLDLPEGTPARAIVRAIVDVAAATGLTCVAEGVETEEQRTIVRELGCIVQGYLEARPMDAAEIDAYLAERSP